MSEGEDEISVELDESGGDLVLGDVEVSVPEGALAEATILTLRRVANEVPGYELYSDVFELEADGAVFAKSVHLSVGYRGEQRLANLFETRAGAAGYFWVATSSTEMAASSELLTSARFFVANGTSYTEPVSATCARVDVVEGTFSRGRAINLLARATDCQGHGLAGLAADDFVGLEDGEALGAGVLAIREPAPWTPFVSFLLDVGLLAVSPDEVTPALDAAIAALAGTGARVGVSLYGDGPEPTELVAPTLDLDAVRAGVEQLLEIDVPTEPMAASFAAMAAVAEAQEQRRTAHRLQNGDGALSAGFVIHISGSASDEGEATQQASLARVAATRDRVIAVPVGEGADGSVNDQVFAAPDGAGLERALLAASQRVVALNGATYWLSYCSEKAQGVHQSGARLGRELFELGSTGAFDATGSLPSCDPAAPHGDCGAKECGQAGCGACDDALAACDLAAGKCVSFCASQNWCGGQAHENPNGYQQTCEDAPTRTACDDACVNLETDAAHCGSCEGACPTGASCVDSECVCPTNQVLCGDECVDTQLSSKHCGKCDAPCAAGEGCFGGECSSSCPTGLPGPALQKVPTPAGGISCIDSTEVTNAQYADFLAAKKGDASGQIPECGWNLYFEPPEGCTRNIYIRPQMELHPQQCVDWCDAAAYCEWAGKRLCGGIDFRQIAAEDLTDPNKDAWYNACSSGGQYNYPHGNTCQQSPCILSGAWPFQVPAGYGCQGKGEYAGVWDLIGNVQEWVDSCTPYAGGDGVLDRCQLRGSRYGGADVSGGCSVLDELKVAQCSFVESASTRRVRYGVAPAVGFRCCAR